MRDGVLLISFTKRASHSKWNVFPEYRNSTPHSWRHKRACKALLDWYSDKQHALSLRNTLLESSLQKTRSPIFPCPCSRASSSCVQLILDNRFLGNSNSPLIRTESESPGLTSYIYCKFNLENPKPRSQQCFVAPFLCISPMIPVTASDFMLCLSEFNPQKLYAHLFLDWCAVPYWKEYQHERWKKRAETTWKRGVVVKLISKTSSCIRPIIVSTVFCRTFCLPELLLPLGVLPSY